MAYARFHPRKNELFYNSKTDSLLFLHALQKAMKLAPKQNLWTIDSFPDFPVVQLDENNFLVIDQRKKLGSGAVAKVYSSRHLVMKDQHLFLMPHDARSPYGAVKIFNSDSIDHDHPPAKEAQVLHQITYSTTSKPLEFKFSDKSHLLIPMRLFRGNSLFDEIVKLEEKLNFEEQKKIEEIKPTLIKHAQQKILQAFDGLLQIIKCLHAMNIAHLDITLENIILQPQIEKKSEFSQLHFMPQLIDFQLSSRINSDDYATILQVETEAEAEDKLDEMREDFDDEDSLRISPENERQIQIHKNVDIYSIALTINTCLEKLDMKKLDRDFYDAMKKVINKIIEAPAHKRGKIEEMRQQLKDIANSRKIDLLPIPYNPFDVRYAPLKELSYKIQRPRL